MLEHAFWSHDYAAGVDALFGQLQKHTEAGLQFVSLLATRSRIERSYAGELALLAQEPLLVGGHNRSGLDQVLGSVGSEAVNEAVLHTRIADELESKIRRPLAKLFKTRKDQLTVLETSLKSRIAEYHRMLDRSEKLRIEYYKQCRRAREDGPRVPAGEPVVSTLRGLRDMYIAPQAEKPALQDEIVVAGLTYSKQSLGQLLDRILKSVSVGEYRVPLLGSYMNVSTGSSIAAASRRLLRNDSIGYSEKFGQALVDLGLLRPVGQLSNRFQSTPSTHYQWPPIAVELAAATAKPALDFTSSSSLSGVPATPLVSLSQDESSGTRPAATVLGATCMKETDVDDGKTGENESKNNDEDNEVQSEAYLQAVLELDMYRTEMELEIDGAIRQTESSERQRVAALKRALSNLAEIAYRPDEVRNMQSRLMMAPGNIDVDAELRALVETHQTGPFVPTVTVFSRFNDNSFVQTFGVDVFHSKFFTGLLLEYLEKNIPPVGVWMEHQALEDVYKLRAQVNTGKPFKPEPLLDFFGAPIVVGVLKEYLLELPESLIPFTVYDKVKSAYTARANSDSEYSEDTERCGLRHDEEIIASLMLIQADAREVLNTLMHFLSRHYLENADELAAALALYIMRPRAVSAAVMNDAHPRLLIAELLRRGPLLLSAAEERLHSSQNTKMQPRLPQPRKVEPAVTSQPSASAGSPVSPAGSGLIPLSLTPDRGNRRSASQVTTPLATRRGLGVSSLPISHMPRRSVSGIPISDSYQSKLQSPGLMPSHSAGSGSGSPMLASPNSFASPGSRPDSPLSDGKFRLRFEPS